MRRLKIILFALTLLSCELEPANPLFEPARFAEVYVEILVATTVDSLDSAQADSILISRGYDREQFEMAVKHFNESAVRWQEVLAEVVDKLEDELNKARAAKADSLQAEDKIEDE